MEAAADANMERAKTFSGEGSAVAVGDGKLEAEEAGTVAGVDASEVRFGRTRGEGWAAVAEDHMMSTAPVFRPHCRRRGTLPGLDCSLPPTRWA